MRLEKIFEKRKLSRISFPREGAVRAKAIRQGWPVWMDAVRKEGSRRRRTGARSGGASQPLPGPWLLL